MDSKLFLMPMKISKLAFIITGLLCAMFVNSSKWRNENVIIGDAFGYYAYLPALFKYGDLTFKFQNALSEKEQQRYWLYENELGNKSPKMTIGLAMCWLPGFVSVEIAHKIANLDSTGWEAPYQLSVGLSAMVFILLGISALLAILRRRFSEMASYSAVVLTLFATNLMYYAAAEPAMGHVYSFSLFALSLNFFDLWLRDFTSKKLLIATILFGWVVLIRPTNVVLGLAFVGFYLASKKSVSKKDVLPALGFILPIMLQVFFWKWNSGHWLYYSYGNEKLYLSRPHIIDGLFSYRNGWFVYTPLALIACIFLFINALRSRLVLFLTITIVSHIYIVFSWWCWYYGDSLSIRPMVDAYAILAFGLAIALDWIYRQKSTIILISMVIAFGLIYNNHLQFRQYLSGRLTGSTMTKAAFWQLFFNAEPSGSLDILGYYKNPDNDQLRAGFAERTVRDTIVEFEWNLLDFSNSDFSNIIEIEGERAQLLDHEFIYSSVGSVKAAEINTSFDRILELEYEFEANDLQKTAPVLVMSFENESEVFWQQGVDLNYVRGLKSFKNKYKTYFKKPQNMPENAELRAFLWLKGKGHIQFKRLTLRQIDCPYAMLQ